MDIPDFMILQSFRYCLDHFGHAENKEHLSVDRWVEWGIENWDKISKDIRELVKKKINQAFDRYDAGLISFGTASDRRQWKRLMARDRSLMESEDKE